MHSFTPPVVCSMWARDSRADTMVQPALGPSLRVAPYNKRWGEGDGSATAHIMYTQNQLVLLNKCVQHSINQLAPLMLTPQTDHTWSILLVE